MKNVFNKKRYRNPKGQSRIDNPEEMAILRTQDKQKTKKSKTKKQKKKKKNPQKTKKMSNIDSNIALYYRFTYLRHCKKKGCIRNHVRFTE